MNRLAKKCSKSGVKVRNPSKQFANTTNTIVDGFSDAFSHNFVLKIGIIITPREELPKEQN